jgi:putative ABC transport system permease protein
MRDWREVVRQHVRTARLTPTAEADLVEELSQHLEQRHQDLIASGVSPEAAEREVLAELGSGEELVRGARVSRARGSTPPALGAERGGSIFRGIGGDVRIAFRMLLRSRGFAAAAVLTLALGIGANTAIFGMIDAVLLRAWPFADPDDLVIVWETDRASNTTHEPASWPDIVDFRERARTVTDIAAFRGSDETLRVAGAEPVRVSGVLVTPNFFELLGVRPLLGSGFRPEEGAIGGSGLTVMLSETLWRTRFNSDPRLIGKAITVGDLSATIVGVAPASADLGIRQVHRRADYGGQFNTARAELWMSLKPTAAAFPRSTHPFHTLARLAPGMTVADAQRELASIAAELERAYPENDARGVNAQPFGEVIFGPIRPAMLLLLIAVGLVLIVTCANVANLLLARTSERLREVAVRRALGASSARIGRQLLTEGVVLTGIGAVCGVGVGWLALRLLVALAPADVPRLADATLDGRVLVFTAAVAGVVALVFGGIPAVRLRGFGLRAALQAQPGRVTEGAGGRRLRGALVVGQIALAVTLFTAAGLLLRSYAALQAVDPGFRAQGVLKAEYQVPWSRYPGNREDWPNMTAMNGFHANVVRRISALPGVQAAAVATPHPLDPGFTNSFVIIGREAESADFPEIRTRFISPGYLATAGVPLLSGRDITAADDATAPLVGLLNRAAAERYFGERDPIGQRIRFRGVEWRIIGVMGNERFKGIDQESEPAVYAPLGQLPQNRVVLLVRAARDPMTLLPAIRHTFRELDPEIPLFAVEPLEQTLTATIAQPRFTTALLGIFSAVTVLLALIGVHGLLAYSVAQRTRELGIRMALGATRREIRRMVLRHAVGLATGGVALGIVLALLGTRLLSTLLFGVTPTDPGTFALVTIIVLGTAAGAAWLPARRATAVNPVEALRD